MSEQQAQSVPIRLYERDDRILLAAPMPGLEPENISVRIAVNQVTIRGDYRGPGQERVKLLMNEWTVGPYYREITLPEAVDGELTNATYGNGVLVISMPKSAVEWEGEAIEFELQPIHSTRGEHIGHARSEINPSTTERKRWAPARTVRTAEQPG